MIQGVAPGQFCVVYDQDHHKCIGSAEIDMQTDDILNNLQ